MKEPIIQHTVQGFIPDEALNQLFFHYRRTNKSLPSIIIVGCGFYYEYTHLLHNQRYLPPNQAVRFNTVEVLLSTSLGEYEVRMY